MTEYVGKLEVLSFKQYAFITRHGISTILEDLYYKLFFAYDNSQFARSRSLDAAASFVTAPHETLLDELYKDCFQGAFFTAKGSFLVKGPVVSIEKLHSYAVRYTV